MKKNPSTEDLLSMFIVENKGRFNKSEAWIYSIKTHCTNMSASIKSLDLQTGQLATELKSQKKKEVP